MVPNEIRPCKLAIVGEAPGKQEVEQGRPFVGGSGQLLFALLGKAGVARTDVSVLNVSRHRPLNNEFDTFDWDDMEVQLGIEQLKSDLLIAQPNCVLACGNAAFHVLTKGNVAPPRKGNLYDWPQKISSWRGSIVPGFYTPKVVASYHPANILRNYSNRPLLTFDVARAAAQRADSVVPTPARCYELQPTVAYIIAQLDDICRNHSTVSVDIEGGVGNITCIGVATSHANAFIIPFGKAHWTLDEECTIWRALATMLRDPLVPKILQNYLYDAFVLSWWAGCHVRGLADDTMLGHWELFPELPKALDLQCSIYTTQPYYKAGRKAYGLEHFEYCLTDCTVTFECRDTILARLRADAEKHYRTNVALLAPFLYMQTKGVRFDLVGVAAERKKLQAEVYEAQHELNLAFDGYSLSAHGAGELLDTVATACCMKRAIVVDTAGLRSNPKAPWRVSIHAIAAIIDRWPDITPAEWGQLETETGVGINVDSNKQMVQLLYDNMGLPKQYRKVRGKRTNSLSTDALSMLTLYTKSQDDRLYRLLRLRQKIDRISALKLQCDDDGRMRCSYNVVGTDTGRVSSYETAHGTGGNMQNRTKSQRKFWQADAGYWYFQCDLVGADGYTVAARSAALGDPTMLDDYHAGCKPKNTIALMHEHGAEVSKLTRPDLCRMAKDELDPDGWLVFACKVCQHGASYLMGAETLSDTILKLSFKFGEKPIYVKPEICERLIRLFLGRFAGVRMWHRDCQRTLIETGTLVCASGHTRRFYGRRHDHATLKAYLAEEPQQNTTFLTNQAALRLWLDPENRRSDGSLIVEPLHQVHDAICGQFPKDQLAWAKTKLHEWFDNPINIAGIPLTIPFDGTFGPSWGETEGEI